MVTSLNGFVVSECIKSRFLQLLLTLEQPVVWADAKIYKASIWKVALLTKGLSANFWKQDKMFWFAWKCKNAFLTSGAKAVM